MKRQCTLIISHSCNLNCVYCYEKFKSKKTMSAPIAKQIIETEITNLDTTRYTGIDFNFIGGEPLTNFALIKEVCEWGRNSTTSISTLLLMALYLLKKTCCGLRRIKLSSLLTYL